MRWPAPGPGMTKWIVPRVNFRLVSLRLVSELTLSFSAPQSGCVSTFCAMLASCSSPRLQPGQWISLLVVQSHFPKLVSQSRRKRICSRDETGKLCMIGIEARGYTHDSSWLSHASKGPPLPAPSPLNSSQHIAAISLNQLKRGLLSNYFYLQPWLYQVHQT